MRCSGCSADRARRGKVCASSPTRNREILFAFFSTRRATRSERKLNEDKVSDQTASSCAGNTNAQTFRGGLCGANTPHACARGQTLFVSIRRLPARFQQAKQLTKLSALC